MRRSGFSLLAAALAATQLSGCVYYQNDFDLNPRSVNRTADALLGKSHRPYTMAVPTNIRGEPAVAFYPAFEPIAPDGLCRIEITTAPVDRRKRKDDAFVTTRYAVPGVPPRNLDGQPTTRCADINPTGGFFAKDPALALKAGNLVRSFQARFRSDPASLECARRSPCLEYGRLLADASLLNAGLCAPSLAGCFRVELAEAGTLWWEIELFESEGKLTKARLLDEIEVIID